MLILNSLFLKFDKKYINYIILINNTNGGNNMLKWALIFLVISIIAGLLGFTGIAGAAATVAKFLFIVFLILCILFFFIGKGIFDSFRKKP